MVIRKFKEILSSRSARRDLDSKEDVGNPNWSDFGNEDTRREGTPTKLFNTDGGKDSKFLSRKDVLEVNGDEQKSKMRRWLVPKVAKGGRGQSSVASSQGSYNSGGDEQKSIMRRTLSTKVAKGGRGQSGSVNLRLSQSRSHKPRALKEVELQVVTDDDSDGDDRIRLEARKSLGKNLQRRTSVYSMRINCGSSSLVDTSSDYDWDEEGDDPVTTKSNAIKMFATEILAYLCNRAPSECSAADVREMVHSTSLRELPFRLGSVAMFTLPLQCLNNNWTRIKFRAPPYSYYDPELKWCSSSTGQRIWPEPSTIMYMALRSERIRKNDIEREKAQCPRPSCMCKVTKILRFSKGKFTQKLLIFAGIDFHGEIKNVFLELETNL